MKILITGGNGFIGSHLVKAFLEAGHIVHVISRNTIITDKPKTGLICFTGEYDDGNLLGKAFKDVDVVFHLAYTTVPENSTLNPVMDVETNVIPSLNLLRICSENKIKKIFFISSGGVVYGNKSVFPIKETDKTNPLSSYGISKWMIENQIKLLSKKLNLDYCIFRVSNAYGSGQHSRKNQGVINIWMEKIMSNEPIQIMGDGSVVRDYIHIDDIVSAVRKSLETNLCGVYNLGTGIGTSLNEIVILLEKTCGKKAVIQYSEGRRFDVEKNILDCSELKKTVGWEPKVKLLEGIKNIFIEKFEK